MRCKWTSNSVSSLHFVSSPRFSLFSSSFDPIVARIIHVVGCSKQRLHEFPGFVRYSFFSSSQRRLLDRVIHTVHEFPGPVSPFGLILVFFLSLFAPLFRSVFAWFQASSSFPTCFTPPSDISLVAREAACHTTAHESCGVEVAPRICTYKDAV